MINKSTNSHFNKNTKIIRYDKIDSGIHIKVAKPRIIRQEENAFLMQAPQKSVNFILAFIKAYKTNLLKNGTYAEIVVN